MRLWWLLLFVSLCAILVSAKYEYQRDDRNHWSSDANRSRDRKKVYHNDKEHHREVKGHRRDTNFNDILFVLNKDENSNLFSTLLELFDKQRLQEILKRNKDWFVNRLVTEEIDRNGNVQYLPVNDLDNNPSLMGKLENYFGGRKPASNGNMFTGEKPHAESVSYHGGKRFQGDSRFHDKPSKNAGFVSSSGHDKDERPRANRLSNIEFSEHHTGPLDRYDEGMKYIKRKLQSIPSDDDDIDNFFDDVISAESRSANSVPDSRHENDRYDRKQNYLTDTRRDEMSSESESHYNEDDRLGQHSIRDDNTKVIMANYDDKRIPENSRHYDDKKQYRDKSPHKHAYTELEYPKTKKNKKYDKSSEEQQYYKGKNGSEYGAHNKEPWKLDREPLPAAKPLVIDFPKKTHKVDYPDPPPPSEAAKMARYIVHNSDWASMATISSISQIKGYPFANTFSISDGPLTAGSGVPYFYITAMDVSIHDLSIDRRCSITMSLAQTEFCKGKMLDPEDPRCAHVSLTGEMWKLKNGSESALQAEEALFSRHPAMKTWPNDHQFFFATLKIDKIFLLDNIGGPKYVSVKEYFRVDPLSS